MKIQPSQLPVLRNTVPVGSSIVIVQICLFGGFTERKKFHFISPDRPVVNAIMQAALVFLQEYRSMVVTSREGWGFLIAVRQKRNGWILPGVKVPPTHASLELG